MSLKTYTSDNFSNDVLNSDKTVIVDFWAPWCPPCRALAPLIEELATTLDGKVNVGKLDTDDNQDIAVKYTVMTIPTVIIFQNGEEVERIVGPSEDDLNGFVTKYGK